VRKALPVEDGSVYSLPALKLLGLITPEQSEILAHIEEEEAAATFPETSIGTAAEIASQEGLSHLVTSRDVTETKPATLHEASAATGLPPRQMRLLDALAWCQRMLKAESVERTILGFAAGVSPKGSGFEKDLGAMRTAGLVAYPSKGEVALTDAGGGVATWPKKAGTKAELFERIKQKLEPRHCRIMDAMWGVGAHVTREELAQHLGVSANGSGFEKDLGRLRTLGLLDYPKPGSVCLGRVLA
jgi:hypothetical protein